MKHIAAGEAKNHFGHLIDLAQREPVTIEKKGRPVAVVMSTTDFEHFQQLEDKIWAAKTIMAEKEGMLSEAESEKFLNELGNAKD